MSYGKARKTSRKMAEDGLTAIPPATLDYWKKVSDVGRYEQLRREVEKRRDFNAAEGWTLSSPERLSLRRRFSTRLKRR
jgi:hypothetical protein